MTIQDAAKLQNGTRVVWREVSGEPSESKGTIQRPPNCIPWIEWEDGQQTSLYDASTLAYVEMP